MLAKLARLLGSESFRDAHRVSPTEFIRKRSLTLPTLVTFVLQLTGGVALQGTLDGFFTALRAQVDLNSFQVPART